MRGCVDDSQRTDGGPVRLAQTTIGPDLAACWLGVIDNRCGLMVRRPLEPAHP